MHSDPSARLPQPGLTVLLSAGPRAGKTTTLRRWQRELGLPAAYLGLTPEDRDPAVLHHRLSRLLAPLSAQRLLAPLSAQRLLAPPSGDGWSALLRALPPMLAVLVDDWHLIEGSESTGKLAAFLWGLPPGSITALASRHRFDDALALAGAPWPLATPAWPERPEEEDLAALPNALRDLVLALGLVGEAAPTEEGDELVRRHIAEEGPGGNLVLNPSWARPAEEALPALAGPATWDRVEALLLAFAQRHRWTQRHAEIAGLLGRIPPEERASRAELLSLEGQQRHHEGAYAEALNSFERALRLRPAAPDLSCRHLLALVMCDPRAARQALASQSASAATLSRSWELVLRSQLLWQEGNLPEAEASMRQLLALPADDDRELAYHQQTAMFYLCQLSPSRLELGAALELVKRRTELAAQWDFATQLPWIAVTRQRLRLQEHTEQQSMELLEEIPNAVCAGSLHLWVSYYLFNIAYHLRLMAGPELALRIYQLSERQAKHVRNELESVGQIASVAQIPPLVELGRMEEAQQRLTEFLTWSSGSLRQEVAHLEWVQIHLMRRDTTAAETALRICAPRSPHLQRRHFLYGELVQVLKGDEQAKRRLRQWLESPERRYLYNSESRLLQLFGLRAAPTGLRLSAFGPLTLSPRGGEPIHWSRRKALLVLAALVLRPEGMPSSELGQLLYAPEGETSSNQTLHNVIYSMRQTLKGSGGETLIDTSQGVVKLDRSCIAFCDLFEFDAFYQRARSFEADGHHEMAVLFFNIALCLVQGELFENLPEEFAEPRAAYRQRIGYAHTYLSRHAP